MPPTDLPEVQLQLPLIGERYAVVERIGKGGAAGVYLAFDTQLKTWRAVKVLHARHGSNPELRGRFLKEARTMARLDHANIVRVLDVSDDGAPYMVMELLEGGCVLDWMRANGRMPASMATRVMVDVCRGLAAVHDRGVVHRDVKPHNILADRRGSCKLTDFGIAKVDGQDLGLDVDHDVTQAGATMGTDAFMAPEQRADASTVDHRADLYSVGATLFTLCTRKTAVDLCMMAADHPDLEPLPPELREVVVKACARRPEDRHQTARELEEVLHQVLWRLPSVPVNLPPLVGAVRELPWRPPKQLAQEALPDLRDLTEPSPDAVDLAAMLGGGAVVTDPDEEEEDALITDLGPAAELAAADPAPTPAPEPVRAATPPPAPQPDAPHQPPAPPDASAAVVEEEPSEPLIDTGLLLRAGASVLILSALAIVMGLGVLWVQNGAEAVGVARVSVVTTRAALHDALVRERSAIDQLAAFGADRGRLEEAYFRFSDAGGAARDDEAEAYLAALNAEHERLQTELSNPAMLSEARARIEALNRLGNAWEGSEAAFEASAASPAASLAVQLGMVEGTPP